MINMYLYRCVKDMITHEEPFLLVKYTVVFAQIQGVVYELEKLNKHNKIVPTTMDKETFLFIVKHFNLSELHRLDCNNVIYGFENFKEQHNKNRKF